jgi:hypothetical protein
MGVIDHVLIGRRPVTFVAHILQEQHKMSKEYNVKEVLDVKLAANKSLMYLVSWEGALV